MWRFIFFGLLAWLILTLIKRSRQSAANPQPDKPSSTTSAEAMVQCEHCAVHLPRSESFLVNGKIYCSKEHIPAQ